MGRAEQTEKWGTLQAAASVKDIQEKKKRGEFVASFRHHSQVNGLKRNYGNT